MQKGRFAIGLANVLATATMLCTCAQAQEPTGIGKPSPFKLSAEKRDSPEGSPTTLRISRDRLNLNANVPAFAPPHLLPQTGALVDPGNFSLGAQDWSLQGSASVNLKSLANYDLELIVDQSNSMDRRDCPGGMSRWEWCGAQLGDLSAQLMQYTPGGFTLTTFASQFDTYEHATAKQLNELFAHPDFNPGTRLSRPLNARLDNYLQHRTRKSKPLLIVVITDGVPAPRVEPERVTDALIQATQQMTRPGEITVVFFQIGGTDRVGRFFLNEMDNELVSMGARADIVRTVYFEQLERDGLIRSLISAVRGTSPQASSR